MRLNTLLEGIAYTVAQGSDTLEVGHLAWDSRKVRTGSVFVCTKGRNVDRHQFMLDAIRQGAVAVVAETLPVGLPEDVTVILAGNTRAVLARMASRYYGLPTDGLRMAGVTGTNGKTSVTWFMAHILEACGRKTGIIGTLGNHTATGELPVEKRNPTTPDAMELMEALQHMRQKGVTDVAMEVTSSALVQQRVVDCRFEVGVFTNLTPDHLDEHGDMDAYLEAKALLFRQCRYGLFNANDPATPQLMAQSCCERDLTFGINTDSDFRADNVALSLTGVTFTLTHEGKTYDVQLPVPGRFSVYNALAAIGACVLMGIPVQEAVSAAASIEGVRGRFQTCLSDKGCLVVVDYAHTPDGLEQVLSTARALTTDGRLITVFGCGGDRDKGKRPVMGRIAGTWSDLCVVTSDNPRTEDPVRILEAIEPGVRETGCDYWKISDRRTAIRTALDTAGPGDVVVIAGKGHETYQIFANRTIHFDDVQEVREYLHLA